MADIRSLALVTFTAFLGELMTKDFNSFSDEGFVFPDLVPTDLEGLGLELLWK